ncbi:MAG: T9SS type A sorting domain-containing protein [Ignavibacteriae bacterium]|nr:T9SS type A sorting domain-containing protein [Ignavibacteriota bacterium]
MKKIILTLIFYICSNAFLNAQWILQSSFTSNNLYDIEFYNRYTGWAVGDGGNILKTTNGGVNWLNIPNPAVGKPLSSIHIVDSNTCYVVGWFETIIKTTNAGDDWIVIRNGGFGFGSSYDAVFFIDENTGWIAGTGQKVLRTTNGGDSIISEPLFAGNLHDMYFKDALTGIVTGSGTDMFKTTNGGLNWSNIVMPIGFRIPDFYKISFVNNQTGWVAGSDRRIFKTIDFGDSWTFIDSIDAYPQMRCVEFIDEKTGFVGGELGYLFKSTNGGSNWVRENTSSFPPNEIISLCLYNELIGWMVGGEAKIFGTTTGGQTLVGISNSEIKQEFILEQNYPNPFNPITKIKYSLNKRDYVEIKIFDVLGKQIKTYISSIQESGNYEIEFDASEINSGVYFYSLFVGGERIETKRMIFLK